MSGEDAPLILTAQLPRDLHARFTALRTAHFPPERNYLEAHVTLFHALPAMCEAEACSVLKRMAAEFAPVPGQVEGLDGIRASQVSSSRWDAWASRVSLLGQGK